MRNIALKLMYNGTAYHGWQVQKNAVTVCGTLEKAIADICGGPVHLTGCGRTDAGVHAEHYIANFRTESRIPVDRIPFAVNTHTPEDIAVKEAFEVAEDFNAIGSCIKKEYTYRIYNSRFKNPFYVNRAYFYPKHLDEEFLNRAAGMFVGTHDFAAVRSVGTETKSTVRTIYYCDVPRNGDLLELKVCANGFLYNMVRAITGTVLYAAEGKFAPEDIPGILERGARTAAGPPGAAAPAHPGGARPHPVQPGLVPVEQGVGAGGVDGAGLKPGPPDGVHRPVELLQLGGEIPPVLLAHLDLGADAGDGHVGQVAVHRQDLLRLVGQEAAEAHAGVDLDVGLHHGGALLRRGVEGHARVRRAHGTHHVQLDELCQLLPIHRGAEHEDLLLHKARLPQGGGLRRLADREAADALLPEHPGQLHQPGPVAVAGEHRVDHRLPRPLLDDADVVPQGFPLNDQRFHGPSAFLCVFPSL